MFDGLSGRGSSPGADPRDQAAARLDAQRQAFRDIGDWLERVPETARDSFCTITMTLSFPPCTQREASAVSVIRAICQWATALTSTAQAIIPPAGKTSAFAPSSRFTLLDDQYYEAAGTARGEDTISQNRACADARKRAHHQAMESMAKAGLCDRKDAALRIVMSFAPPVPALLGGGRYGISGFEAICDWNLVIEAVHPDPDAQNAGVHSTLASGSVA